MSIIDMELLNQNPNQVEFLDFLGGGTFGNTYRAKVVDDTVLQDCFGNEVVAVKVPKTPSAQWNRIILRESQKLTNLTSQRDKGQENVVRYYTSVFLDYSDQGAVGIVMEYVKDGDLRHYLGRIQDSRRLPTSFALEIITGMLKGLVYIHKRDVLHLDLKPENILMEGHVPKIADLGASKFKDRTVVSIIAGTPPYDSPEKCNGSQNLTEQEDLWAVSVILYEVLGGKFPFGAGLDISQVSAIHKEILDCNVQPLQELAGDLPSELISIVNHSLRKDPEERYKNAHNMLIALSSYQKKYMSRRNDHIRSMKRKICNTSKYDQNVVRSLKQCVKKYPTEPEIVKMAIDYFQKLRMTDLALEVCDKVVDLTLDPVIQYYCGLTYKESGQHDVARICFQRVRDSKLKTGYQKRARTVLTALGDQ